MLTREEAKKITDRVLALTAFPECSVSLYNSETASIRYALNGVTTSGFQVDQALSISVTKDNKTGSTSVSEFDDKSLREAMQRAEQLSDVAPPNPEFLPGLGPQQYANFDNFIDATAAASTPTHSLTQISPEEMFLKAFRRSSREEPTTGHLDVFHRAYTEAQG